MDVKQRLDEVLRYLPDMVIRERLEVRGLVEVELDDVNALEDQFLGSFDTLAEFGREHLDDLLLDVPESVKYYFDFDHWARDAEISGDVEYIHYGGQVYVFSNHG
jgi:antirestriction protein